MPGKNRISDRMSVLTDYGETLVVMVSKSNRFSSPMESTLHCKRGRSWALSDTPNLSGVERTNQQNRIPYKI